MSQMEKLPFKGATKSYFTHYSCVVIILFNTGLSRSAFSKIYFGKLVFYVFSLNSKCEFSFENSSLKRWLCFRLFLRRTQK